MVEENENDEGNDEGTKPEVDPVVEHVEEQLEDDDKKPLTLAHLKELTKQLDDRMDAMSKDKSKDADYRTAMEGKIERLEEHIKKLTEALEKKEQSGGDSTMLIPPDELNPKQQNSQVDDDSSSSSNTNEVHHKKGWKRFI